MPEIPEIIKTHVAYANPYKITHAHGIVLEQSGKLKPSVNSKWQNIKSISDLDYPKVEFYQKLNSFLSSETKGINNATAFLKSKAFGITKTNESHSDELFQRAAMSYLSCLVWMPWSFCSEHIILKPIDDFTVHVSLTDYPDIGGEFSFSEEARITSFTASRYRFEDNSYQLCPWKVEYSKYNIKKSYKLPTQIKCYWVENNEEFLYLDFEKVLGYTVK